MGLLLLDLRAATRHASRAGLHRCLLLLSTPIVAPPIILIFIITSIHRHAPRHGQVSCRSALQHPAHSTLRGNRLLPTILVANRRIRMLDLLGKLHPRDLQHGQLSTDHAAVGRHGCLPGDPVGRALGAHLLHGVRLLARGGAFDARGRTSGVLPRNRPQ